MRNIKFLGLALFMAFGTSVIAQKIGHVNMESIVVDMPQYKLAMDSLQVQQKKVEGQLKRLESEFERAQKLYQDSAKMWDPATRRIKQNDLVTMETNYKQFYQLSTVGLDSMQQQSLGRLVNKVKEAAQVVAKEKGMTYVLNYSEQAQLVLYYEDEHDLTAAVRKKLQLP